MDKKKDEKNVPQLIIEALMTGASLSGNDISKMISESSGRTIRIQDFSSLLTKISDKKKCNLGYFVKREKKGNSYVYSFVEDILALSEKKVYGLSLKVGKESYPLDEAIKDYPDLAKYVGKKNEEKKETVIKGKTVTKGERKKAAPPKKKKESLPTVKEEPEKVEEAPANNPGEPLATQLLQKIASNGEMDIKVNVTFTFEKN